MAPPQDPEATLKQVNLKESYLKNSNTGDISSCQRIGFDWQIYTKHQILVIITIFLMFIELALHSFLLVLQWAAH